VLTFEEMFLQAAPGHELVDEQPVLVLVAVADQLHEVRVPQLPQEDDFGLHGFRTTHSMGVCQVVVRESFSLLILLPFFRLTKPFELSKHYCSIEEPLLPHAGSWQAFGFREQVQYVECVKTGNLYF